MTAIGVDLGGTRLRVGLVSDANILWKAAEPTEAAQGPQSVLRRMERMIEQAQHESDRHGEVVVGIGVGCPGPLDARAGVVLDAPNLPGWDGVRLVEHLGNRFGLPTRLDNDANVAALAEWRFGAGRGYRNVVYVTISTGIGGGVVAEGQLLQGAAGGVAEIGHICIQAVDGVPCACGNTGCLEAYASGTGIVNRMERLLRESSQSSVLRGKEISPETIASAVHLGDPLATSFMQETSYYLGIGLSNVVTIFNPELLIVGGGLTALRRELIQPALDIMRLRVFPGLGRELRVDSPLLGDDSGLIGAAALCEGSF